MGNRIGSAIIAATLSLGGISGCERVRGIEVSPEVTSMTENVVMQVNIILETTKDGRAIKHVLSQLPLPASCTIVTEIDRQSGALSKILCETAPMPGRPGGLLAIVGPIPFQTSFPPMSQLSTIGVHLEDGYFDPSSGCSIYHIEAGQKIIGSDDEVCRDINAKASTLVQEAKKKLEDEFNKKRKI